MRILYELYNGKKIWLEVEEQVGDAYKEIVRVQRNRDRVESDHLTKGDSEMIIANSPTKDDESFAAIFEGEGENARLRVAISRLNAKQRALIRAVFVQEISASAYAKQQGVSKAAISQKIKTVIRRINKYM